MDIAFAHSEAGEEDARSRLMEIETPAADVIDEGLVGYVEYEIDIEKVLRADLPGVLDGIPMAPLNSSAVRAIPEFAKGAYVIYENGHPVYAGKTDTRHGFRQRLDRHAYTVQHRQNLDPENLSFKAIRILVFSNFDVEAILIDELRKSDPTALKWNDSGFGSNDPGHRRETQDSADFDKERPIDIDRPITQFAPGDHALFPLFVALKASLPYTFRYQTDHGKGYRIGHVDHREAPPLSIATDEVVTMRSILTKALAALPEGWRATVFPDRVILYKEPTQYTAAIETLTA